MLNFVKRLIIIFRIFLAKKKEPFFKKKYLYNYLTNGYFFPSYKKIDYKPLISVKNFDTTPYVIYNNIKIYYPNIFNTSLAVENFNNLLNEQTAIGENINPHKYLSTNELKSDWVIYDIGAAEGSQSKFWLDSVKQIILFEPLPSFYNQLKKTFQEDILNNKVILINCGVSKNTKVLIMENEKIIFDTLENLMTQYNLPTPNYIKADIEGEEMNLLESSVDLFKKIKLDTIQITTYHRPFDYIHIPNFFKQFNGVGFFSQGVMLFNRNGLVKGSYRKKIYHPILRKCLYTFTFDNK